MSVPETPTGLVRLSVLVDRPAKPAAPGEAADVVDLVADIAADPARVTRVVHKDEVDAANAETGLTELWLVRDVLDAPVYDVGRGSTVRVGEVWLLDQPGHPLVVAGLEVGSGTAWHRLLPRRHRATSPMPGARMLALTDVHLASRHGHRAQLAAAGSAVHHLDEDQLAGLLTSLPVEMAAEVVNRLPAERVDAALGRLHSHVSARLARALDTGSPTGPRRTRRTAGWRMNKPRPGGDGPTSRDRDSGPTTGDTAR